MVDMSLEVRPNLYNLDNLMQLVTQYVIARAYKKREGMHATRKTSEFKRGRENVHECLV